MQIYLAAWPALLLPEYMLFIAYIKLRVQSTSNNINGVIVINNSIDAMSKASQCIASSVLPIDKATGKLWHASVAPI